MLMAMSADRILRFLGVLNRPLPNGETWPVILTGWAITQAFLFIQSVQDVATITALVLLATFFVVNIACFTLTVTGAPNFRPLFRYFSWHTCLAGAVLCLVSMFFVQHVYAALVLLAAFVLLVIFHYIAPPTSWGDISQALIFHQVCIECISVFC